MTGSGSLKEKETGEARWKMDVTSEACQLGD